MDILVHDVLNCIPISTLAEMLLNVVNDVCFHIHSKIKAKNMFITNSQSTCRHVLLVALIDIAHLLLSAIKHHS